MNKLIEQLDLYFGKKAPQLPRGFKEGIVKFAPIIVIIGLIFFALAIIPLLGLVAASFGLSAIAGAVVGQSGFSILISLAALVVIELLYLFALPGLKSRTIKGWNFVFYAQLVSALDSLLHVNLFGLVIGAVIGFYFLFQIRPYYTGAATIGQASEPMQTMTPPGAGPTSTM